MWGTKQKRVYLDWAAAAPVSPRARGVYSVALSAEGNPGAHHTEGRRAKALLEDARTKIARMAEVKASGVVFTSGATEANNLAIQGVALERRANVPAAPYHVLYLPSAHASTVETVRALERHGIEIEPLVLEDGAISLSALKGQLRPQTILVVTEAVCGETGTLWNTRDVRRTLDSYVHDMGARILLHVDASQAPLMEGFTLEHLGADILALDAQKVGGVRGVGVLLLRTGVRIAPLLQGGGQEGGRRPGTENHAGAAAFASALTEAEENRERFTERAQTMRATLLDAIQAFPRLEVNEGKRNVPHILNISLLGRDTDYLVALLDTAGFAVSTKSACESDSEEGSRAVLALTDDDARASATLRISWGPGTKERDLERFAGALLHAVRFLDENAI